VAIGASASGTWVGTATPHVAIIAPVSLRAHSLSEGIVDIEEGSLSQLVER
jgi:hypothetical protein